MSWNQLPKLDLAVCAELDSWFLSFEARMAAARVPEEYWAAKFVECPSVDESLKVRVRGMEPFTYFTLRRKILQEHGPIDPVNYFKREMYRVRGNNAEDVRETLTKLLTLHNRAAQDDGSQGLRERDLCYPFLEAFPSSVQSSLERQLALIFAQEQPFEHLYRLAPSKKVAVEECQVAEEYLTEQTGLEDSQGAHNELADALALVLQQVRRSQPRTQDRKRRRVAPKSQPLSKGNSVPLGGERACWGCGGTCMDRVSCPARGKKCSSCRGMGHFARVCRKGTPFQRSPARL